MKYFFYKTSELIGFFVANVNHGETNRETGEHPNTGSNKKINHFGSLRVCEQKIMRPSYTGARAKNYKPSE